ncbi:hypothetical protein AVEN_162565-1 [Araneus ventricosus]|uniref:Uncharacterized protein n=1 Tax=Araneus ventricosus TaxID=182803 RepID=A0A4Y2S8X8_ARAVE|nr:hypothetical protein AVEN_162565-1 [Araneus ventricosus]
MVIVAGAWSGVMLCYVGGIQYTRFVLWTVVGGIQYSRFVLVDSGRWNLVFEVRTCGLWSVEFSTIGSYLRTVGGIPTSRDIPTVRGLANLSAAVLRFVIHRFTSL